MDIRGGNQLTWNPGGWSFPEEVWAEGRGIIKCLKGQEIA